MSTLKTLVIENMKDSKVVFIGLAEIKPKEGNNFLKDKDWAIVKVIGKFSNEEDMNISVKLYFDKIECDLIDLRNVELFNQEKKYFDDNVDFTSVLKTVEREGEIQIGTFYGYKNDEEINNWLALVQVKPANDNDTLNGALGAFVNVAYRAWDINNLEDLISSTFKEQDYEVLNIEDIETENDLNIDNSEEAEKLELLKDIKEEGYSFSWGTFYTYENEED
ncbi:hypothetical protein [Aquimarina longa]|uniref:hypothetical protein n=1 Tax=Aquimarina longa TaxID=1080221 RepID=UPI0007849B37|nr:hypothetical protein [Aquimarina longa]